MEEIKSPATDLEEAAHKRRVRRNWLLSTPALVVLFCAASGPLLIVLVYSFLSSGEYGGIVWKFSTRAWFNVVFMQDIFDETVRFADAHLLILWRSVKLSLFTTVITLCIGFPTAYFIATRSRTSRNIWLFLITIPFWTNLLIRTFAILEILRNRGLINMILLQVGITKSPIQMVYTDFAIMVGMAYVYLPLMVLPLYASMERLNFSIVEAAYDLYATRSKVLRRVIIPLVKPGIIAGSILVFIPSLGAFVTPQVLGGGRKMMLGNLIELQFGAGHNWPLGAALSITLLSIVVIALLVYVRTIQRNSDGLL